MIHNTLISISVTITLFFSIVSGLDSEEDTLNTISETSIAQNSDTAIKNADTIMERQSADSTPKELAKIKPGSDTALHGKKSIQKSDASDIEFLRKEAKLLREQADKLYAMAENFDTESRAASSEIKELETKADELENQAQELLKQAALLQSSIKASLEAYTLSKSAADTSEGKRDTVSEPMKEQKLLMLQMRNNADNLLIKAKKMAVKGREMKENADGKDDLADRFNEKARELESKAQELIQKAETLEERDNKTPFSVRFPVALGHQIRFSMVPPLNDRDAHILFISGFNVIYYFNKSVNAGVEDISLLFNQTVYGTRTAISGSPVVSFSYFPAKRCELGGGIGFTIQGQFGADRESNIAFAPCIKLYNENAVWRHFTIGPVVKCSYLINGNFFTRGQPANNPDVLPEKAFWISLGLIYNFHL